MVVHSDNILYFQRQEASIFSTKGVTGYILSHLQQFILTSALKCLYNTNLLLKYEITLLHAKENLGASSHNASATGIL